MNKDQFAGTWHQMKGQVKQQWAKLTDDDITAIDGKREELVGRLQKTYGYNKEKASQEVDSFFNED